ncbi:TPM domain-containing protein [Dyella sp.]|uniref:TPM domain-containing protein n=1 Tax=Dyella sp. TaxID=1869338 RepID=UPI002ED69DAF
MPKGKGRVVALGRWLTLWLLCIGLASLAMADELPSLEGRVNDYAKVLGDTSVLEQKLAAEEARSGDQVVVLTVPDLKGRDIESFSNDTFHRWRLGHKGVDNGVLIVLAINDRRARIEVGYGLEGDLTDATTAMILRDHMHPFFTRGDYARGVNEGVDAVLDVLAHAEPVATPEPHEQHTSNVPGWVAVFAFVLTLIFALMASTGGGLYTLWTPFACSIFVFIAAPWMLALGILVLALVSVYLLRRRDMRKAFRRDGRVRKAYVDRGLTAWPPSLWQIMLWTGTWTVATSSRSTGWSSSDSATSWSSDSSSSSDWSSSSDSSDFSGGGGDSGGGGSSDSW